jgi:ATP-binding cassette subfamily B protein
VSKGELLINGQNINDIRIADWYRNIGILFQEYNRYDFLSAEENIAIGDISREDKKGIREAAKMADAHELINEFEFGYDQILSEKYEGGTRPSSGQWQKIAIARFFYRNAPVVIFDEPTAAIDAVAEYRIFNKIYEFFTGKTVIIISHRFSTVRNADRIIVFEKGKIAEQGSHDELMAMNGKYAEAFRLQAEGYS